jgi:hypothetical protein
MRRVTVGHLDACVYPLWLSRINVRDAHLIIANAGASFMGEGAKGLWRLADLMRRLRRL